MSYQVLLPRLNNKDRDRWFSPAHGVSVFRYNLPTRDKPRSYKVKRITGKNQRWEILSTGVVITYRTISRVEEMFPGTFIGYVPPEKREQEVGIGPAEAPASKMRKCRNCGVMTHHYFNCDECQIGLLTRESFIRITNEESSRMSRILLQEDPTYNTFDFSNRD
jgi:hypothetical protein